MLETIVSFCSSWENFTQWRKTLTVIFWTEPCSGRGNGCGNGYMRMSITCHFSNHRAVFGWLSLSEQMSALIIDYNFLVLSNEIRFFTKWNNLSALLKLFRRSSLKKVPKWQCATNIETHMIMVVLKCKRLATPYTYYWIQLEWSRFSIHSWTWKEISSFRRRVFQQDEATVHTGENYQEHLQTQFCDWIISCNGYFPWPPRSHYLSTWDFVYRSALNQKDKNITVQCLKRKTPWEFFTWWM